MAKFIFPVHIVGTGATREEAWDDAVFAFEKEPGFSPEPSRFELEQYDAHDQMFVDGECPADQGKHHWAVIDDEGAEVECVKCEVHLYHPTVWGDDGTAWPSIFGKINENADNLSS